MAKVIGKANKFYTLWEVTEDTYRMHDGRPYTVTHHIYMKNLSFDKETAMAKVPVPPLMKAFAAIFHLKQSNIQSLLLIPFMLVNIVVRR